MFKLTFDIRRWVFPRSGVEAAVSAAQRRSAE